MSDPHNGSCVSRLFPNRVGAVARAFLVSSLLALLACQGDVLTPSVVPIHIVAVPATDTLTLADWVFLTVRADSTNAMPTRVVWTTFPAGDSTVSDTLWYHPKVAGTVLVQVVATFDGGGSGVAAQHIVTRRDLAPVASIVPLGPKVVPIGDTIRLRADLGVRGGTPGNRIAWFLGDTITQAALVGRRDTVIIPVSTAGAHTITLRVTDPIGAFATDRIVVTSYDPITPFRWRRHVSQDPIADLAQRHDGDLVVQTGPRMLIDTNGSYRMESGPRALLTLQPDGTLLRQQQVHAAGTRGIAIGPDDAVYVASGIGIVPPSLERYSSSGEVSLADSALWVSPVISADGLIISQTSFGGSTPSRCQAWNADGQVVWSTQLDQFYPDVSAIASDSTLYIGGSSFSATHPGPSVMALAPDGRALRTMVVGGDFGFGVSGLTIGDDSTIFVLSDSLYAMRPDGSIRWALPTPTGSIVTGMGKAFFATPTGVRAVGLTDGSTAWTAAVPMVSYFASAPVLSAAGELFVPAGPYIVAYDANTGAERWRHRMADTVSAPLLLTPNGTLVAGDALGYVEAIKVGSGPAPSAWPMAAADPRRTSRAHTP